MVFLTFKCWPSTISSFPMRRQHQNWGLWSLPCAIGLNDDNTSTRESHASRSIFVSLKVWESPDVKFRLASMGHNLASCTLTSGLSFHSRNFWGSEQGSCGEKNWSHFDHLWTFPFDRKHFSYQYHGCGSSCVLQYHPYGAPYAPFLITSKKPNWNKVG